MSLTKFNRQVRHELKKDLEDIYLKFVRQNKKYIEERISVNPISSKMKKTHWNLSLYSTRLYVE